MRVRPPWSSKWTGWHAHSPWRRRGGSDGASEHDHSFIYPITINNAFCDFVAAIILFIGKGWFTSWSCSLGSHFQNARLRGRRSSNERNAVERKTQKRGLTRIPGAYSNDIGGILPGPAKLNSENEDISQLPTKKEKSSFSELNSQRVKKRNNDREMPTSR